MGDEQMTVIFGVLSIIPTLILMFELWWVYVKVLRKRFMRAEALLKAVIDTQGRASFDEIIRLNTLNHAGGVDDNVVLDLLVSKYKGVTIKQLEAANSQSGTYRPGADSDLNARHRTQAEFDAEASGRIANAKVETQHKYARYNALAKLIRQKEDVGRMQ